MCMRSVMYIRRRSARTCTRTNENKREREEEMCHRHTCSLVHTSSDRAIHSNTFTRTRPAEPCLLHTIEYINVYKRCRCLSLFSLRANISVSSVVTKQRFFSSLLIYMLFTRISFLFVHIFFLLVRHLFCVISLVVCCR